MKYYIHQGISGGIGNFINLTPSIQILYEYFKEPIPVYFCTNYIEQMYTPWKKIIPCTDIKDKKRILSTSVNKKLRKSGIPEWKYKCLQICETFNIKYKNIPHTFVPKYDIKTYNNYIVIARGCLGAKWLKKKDPGDKIYKYILTILTNKYPIIFIGGEKEREQIFKMNNWIQNKGYVYINNIEKSIALVYKCTFMISNDTGMYHVAGSFNKHIFVLWKNTSLSKNKSPGKNCFYSKKENWYNDFKNFLKNY